MLHRELLSDVSLSLPDLRAVLRLAWSGMLVMGLACRSGASHVGRVHETIRYTTLTLSSVDRRMCSFVGHYSEIKQAVG